MHKILRGLLALALVVTASAALAAPGAQINVSASSIQWSYPGSYDRLVLTIGGPEGFTLTKEFEIGRLPALRISELATRTDGQYTWELRAMPRISEETKKQLAAAREADDDAAIARIKAEAHIEEEAVQSGGFLIIGGSFVTPAAEGPSPAGPKVTASGLKPAPNDVVTADDEIIQGSLCVGLDCVVNESFGFDTIRLKENNTRIVFYDTSTSSGFPNVHWQLTANDSASGGLNKFSIDDLTNSKTPFTVVASAPTNSMFVASSGKVGFGNSSPVLNLHVTATDTPAIRQEQTSGGGFTAQTWDIGANEANWFVRDVTGGSRLPLRIRPGAPTSSIDIAASGFVGVGTASPALNLDVRGIDPLSNILAAFGTGSTANSLNIGYAGAIARGAGFFSVVGDASTVAPNPSLRFFTALNMRMIIDYRGYIGLGVAAPSQPIQHSNGAFLSVGGVWTDASSRALKDNITDLTSDEASRTLEELRPVKFSYKADAGEHHTGFIAEDVPELVASRDRKGVSPMDIAAVLTRVIQEQQKTIDELKARLDKLEKAQSAN